MTGLTTKGYAALIGAATLTALLATPLKAQTGREYQATAYCCIGRGGGHCGRTASGAWVGPGQIAADPRVLPMGSRVLVSGYGEAVVTDTGSAIKGAKVDVFFPMCTDAWAWGRRTVTVTPLPPVVPRYTAPALTHEDTAEWDEANQSWVHRRVSRNAAGEVVAELSGISVGAQP